MIQATFFYLVALAVISTAWYAVSSSKLLNAALSLALSFFAIGGLYFMLGVPFLGMLQILINAGAIPIVTIFIIMMTQSRRIKLSSPINQIAAFGAMFVLAVGVTTFIYRYATGTSTTFANTVAATGSGKLGEALLSSPETNGINGSLLAFEVASIILTVAMVGAIVLTKRDGETIKGDVGVLSEVDKPVNAGELLRPAMTVEADLERTGARLGDEREKVMA
jgi:NADH-quinone oxidoreductase subunit J